MRTAKLPLLSAFFLAACGVAPAPQKTITSVAHPEWSRSAVIYEVNVRQYTPEGTLAAIEPHLPRLKKLGVDILWIMPVQPIGVKNRKGPLGSYYSIRDYRAINPEFGTAADFRKLVDAAHALGMRVILDWVPNHTAFDHTWITAHPDWYVHGKNGQVINARDNENHDTDWTDVAELNYDNEAMRQAMIADMKYWVDSMNVDGFRDDVAGGVPYDFWRQARSALQAAKPGLFMLAEAEDPRMHESFDMTYGWEFHHLLNDIAQGKKGTGALDAYFAKQAQTYPRDAYRMYFTSNHDENSWNGTEFERMGENAQAAFILCATVQQSMPLLYSGQEAALHKRLRFFEKDTIDWSGADGPMAAFYTSVFALKHAQSALANGAWGGDQVKLATDGGEATYAFTRTVGSNTVLVAVNFGATPATLSYTGLTRAGGYTDWFGKQTVELPPTGKLDVPAHGYRVLVRS